MTEEQGLLTCGSNMVTLNINAKLSRVFYSLLWIQELMIQAGILLQTTRTRRSCLSAGRSQPRTTQNEQATQHRRLLPRRCCSNHGPVRDVLTRRTSRLDYALFVKGISAWIIVPLLDTMFYFRSRWQLLTLKTASCKVQFVMLRLK